MPTESTVKIPSQILWPLISALAGGGGVMATNTLRTDAATAEEVQSLERLHDQRITALEVQISVTNSKLDKLDDKLDSVLIELRKVK
jgi:hypothetical protein